MNERTKKVYDAFGQKRFRHKLELKRKQEALYQQLPELKAIETQINLQGIRMTQEAARKNPNAITAFRQQVEALNTQRDAILAQNGYPKDYLSITYDCPNCEDTGYIDGKACTCLKQALIKVAFTGYDLNVYTQAENFNTFTADYYPESTSGPGVSPRERMGRLKEKMQYYCDHFETQNDNYLLAGPTGAGKTFMSHCIANALIQRGFEIIYITAAHLIQDIQSKIFDDKMPVNEIYAPLFMADLLIIDDFGAEFHTEFGKKQLFEVINTRLQEQKKIVISTNLNKSQLLDNYDERLTSRIQGNFVNITFAGQDIRLAKKMEN